jgi:hypothetical protein
MSERGYSGLSRVAIQKARKAGRLVVYGDGVNGRVKVGRADMTDPDQQRRSTGGDSGFSGLADSSSYLKARTALTVYQAQERQLAIQKKKGTLIDRARAEALVFRLARQERDVWVTWPARVAALMGLGPGLGKLAGRTHRHRRRPGPSGHMGGTDKAAGPDMAPSKRRAVAAGQAGHRHRL